MFIGRGKRTRIAPLTSREGVRGGRFVSHTEPHEALSLGVSAMKEARFILGADDLVQELAASRSPWIATELLVGNPRTTGLFHTPGLGDPDDLLVPFTWSYVVPTLAVVCARRVPAGSELVLLAHPSPTRSFGREDEIRPLMQKAYRNLIRVFGKRLVHHEPITRIQDDSCPASLAFVTQELNWD